MQHNVAFNIYSDDDDYHLDAFMYGSPGGIWSYTLEAELKEYSIHKNLNSPTLTIKKVHATQEKNDLTSSNSYSYIFTFIFNVSSRDLCT
jgi:hypothetical protein